MEKVLPKGWEDFHISTLVTDKGMFSDGDWVESKDQDPEGEVRLIQLADIGINDFRNKSNRFIKHDRAKELKCTFINKNDVLIARMPDPIGRACVFPLSGKYVTVVDVAIIRFEQKHFNHSLFSYFVNSPEIGKQISELASGSTRQRISRKNLDTILFPLPPLAEQERIVAKLDALFAQHEVMKKTLEHIPQLLKNFRQQVLTQAVAGKLTKQWREGKDLEEWMKDKLSYFLKPKGIFDGPFGSNLKTEDYIIDGDVRVIRLENIGSMNFIDNNSVFISKEKYNALQRHEVFEGDLIFSSFIADRIRACILPKMKMKMIAKADCFCLRVDETLILNNYLLISLVNMEAFKRLLLETRGATRPRINTTILKNYILKVPPLQEQQEIVSRVELLFTKADAIEARYKNLKTKIESLPQALLHKAFKGELVPQLPTDGDAKNLLAEIMALKKDVKGKKKS